MKQKLTPATYVPLAQEVVLAAYQGDLDSMKRCIANGGETALLKDDVPNEQPFDPDLMNFDNLGLMQLHEDDQALNAAMYWAAFRGHTAVVEYFLDSGDYCQDTLGASLYGAVCSKDEALVKKLVEAGANPAHEDHTIIERAIARGYDGIAGYLIEKSGAYNHALAAYITHGNFAKSIEMLDHDVDVRRGLDAIANKLTDRAMMVSDRGKDRYFDTYEALMGYAEAKGEDMNDLVAYITTRTVEHWSSPLANRLVDNPHFANHPQRQQLLDTIAVRTVLSSDKRYDTCYPDYFELIQKLVTLGASKQAVLSAAADAVNTEACLLAFNDNGGDPRRGRPSVARRVTKKYEQRPGDADLADFKKVVDVVVDTLDRLDHVLIDLSLERSASPVEALRSHEMGLNRTCLMRAVISGRGEEALGHFITAGATLTPGDIFTADDTGTKLIDLLYERDETAMLCDRRLFEKRQDYMTFWDKLPDDAKALAADRHADVLAALSSSEAFENLAKKRAQDKARYKL